MRYGRTPEPGFLPIYSVDTEEEAYDLLVLACGRNRYDEFVAEELAQEQTLENLFAFGARLEKAHNVLKESRARRDSHQAARTNPREHR